MVSFSSRISPRTSTVIFFDRSPPATAVVTAGDRSRDVGDVADLRGEVRRHEVDVVGQVLPGAGDAGHLGLTAELALGADLAGHPRHLRGEAVELVHHGVDGVLELQDLPPDVDGDLPVEVAPG